MALITAVWQKLVWCGLAGGVLGLAIGVVGLFQRTAAQAGQPVAFDVAFDTLAGTLLGLILLGVPASLWVFGKWAFHGRQVQVVAQPNAAMVGSTAAVPGAIIGGA